MNQPPGFGCGVADGGRAELEGGRGGGAQPLPERRGGQAQTFSRCSWPSPPPAHLGLRSRAPTSTPPLPVQAGALTCSVDLHTEYPGPWRRWLKM